MALTPEQRSDILRALERGDEIKLTLPIVVEKPQDSWILRKHDLKDGDSVTKIQSFKGVVSVKTSDGSVVMIPDKWLTCMAIEVANKLMPEPKEIGGLLSQIEKNGNTATYSEVTFKDFEDIINALDK